MYQRIHKRPIRRRQNDFSQQELQNLILMLELCREADDDLWRQLILQHIESLEILSGKEGRRIKKEIRRKLRRGY